METDISVIICTRNRAASLAETLQCLADADRAGLNIEIVVVNNGGQDDYSALPAAFEKHFPIRLLDEPKQGVFGKSHALNRALAHPGLGSVLVVLDDDMTTHRDWFQGISAICARWPDKDFFTGRTYVVWPDSVPPAIAESGPLRTWMYSITDEGTQDRLIESGRWYAGGHFWFRSRCLSSGIRFDDTWLTEPKFMLDLVELGYGGVSAPDAVAGHRIQDRLLSKSVIRERAIKVGRDNAEVRLRPFRHSVKQARFFHRHPFSCRLFCCARLLQASLRWFAAQLHPAEMKRFVNTVVALEQLNYHVSFLRLAGEMQEYRMIRARSK
jgi:glycosyltransferase involved in cell wall biosynthesis